MLCVLSDNYKDDIQDLLLATYGEHPTTYGDSYMDHYNQMRPLETVLTDRDDLCSNQSLDYIFQLTPKSLFTEEFEKKLPLKKSRLQIMDQSARVEKFFVEDQQFSQLSDHYGVMVSLEYSEGSDLSIVKQKSEKHVLRHLYSGEKSIVLE